MFTGKEFREQEADCSHALVNADNLKATRDQPDIDTSAAAKIHGGSVEPGQHLRASLLQPTGAFARCYMRGSHLSMLH